MTEIIHKDLSYKAIGLAMEVHNKLGSGFLEKVYENSLMILFKRDNIQAKNQYPISVYFEEQIVGEYFADILLEDKIILELKAVENITDIHKAQLINYLKATKCKLGILINFGNKKLQYERFVL
jgi:GxxExxY protein